MSTDTASPFGNPTADDGQVFELDDEQQAALDESDDRFKIDEGDYRARVIDLEQGTSKAGNSMWVWTWAIVHGTYEGRELKLWTALTPRAMFKLREVLEALRVWSTGEKVRIVPKDIMNKEAIIKIVNEEYNDRVSPKIESVSKCDDQTPSAGHKPQTGNDDDIPF